MDPKGPGAAVTHQRMVLGVVSSLDRLMWEEEREPKLHDINLAWSKPSPFWESIGPFVRHWRKFQKKTENNVLLIIVAVSGDFQWFH